MGQIQQIGPANDWIGPLLGGIQQKMEQDKQSKQAMLMQMIQSGQYQPVAPGQGQPQSFGQRFLGGLTGPQVGGATASMNGQQFQFMTPEKIAQQQADKLKMQMSAYSGLLGGGTGEGGATQVSNPSMLEKELSIDPETGNVKLNLKSKPQDQGMGGLNDVANKTPEELQSELKQKNPGYAKLLSKYADGTMQLSGRGAKQRTAIQKDLANMYPGMDESKIQSRFKTRTDFSTGTAAKNIKSLNTAVGHLSEFKKLIPELHNGNWKMANQAGQWWARQTGGQPSANLARFNAVKNALSGELSTIYKNTGGTDQEIKHVMDSFDSADSPAALQAASDEIENLMASRTSALQDQWHNAFDRPDDPEFPVLSNRSKQVLKGIGFDDKNVGDPSSSDQSQKLGKYSFSVI